MIHRHKVDYCIWAATFCLTFIWEAYASISEPSGGGVRAPAQLSRCTGRASGSPRRSPGASAPSTWTAPGAGRATLIWILCPGTDVHDVITSIKWWHYIKSNTCTTRKIKQKFNTLPTYIVILYFYNYIYKIRLIMSHSVSLSTCPAISSVE